MYTVHEAGPNWAPSRRNGIEHVSIEAGCWSVRLRVSYHVLHLFAHNSIVSSRVVHSRDLETPQRVQAIYTGLRICEASLAQSCNVYIGSWCDLFGTILVKRHRYGILKSGRGDGIVPEGLQNVPEAVASVLPSSALISACTDVMSFPRKRTRS